MSLVQIAQTAFEAGMMRLAPHLLPPNSAWTMDNLLLDVDGSAYKRGGVTAVTSDDFGSGLRFLWDGDLAGGHRTVFASSASMGTIDVDGETPIDFTTGGIGAPRRAAVLEGLLFVDDWAYGGSRLTAGYSTGTVAVTEGDETVVGTGTAWIANLDPGMVLNVGGRLLAVKAVTDDTHLELYVPWPGATDGSEAYTAAPVQAIPAAYHPNGIYAAVGNRLLSADGANVFMSKGGDSTTWDVTEYHAIPAGDIPVAIEGIGDLAYVFTTGGVWGITNLPFDLTDDLGNPQQTLERVSGDVIVQSAPGVTFWDNQIVVPALDGVWLFGKGSPELLTRSIGPLWNEIVRSGYSTGKADVMAGYLHLPIIDDGVHVQMVLACRLDRPVRIRGLGVVYPWTTLSGAGVQVTCFAARVERPPALLGAERDGGLVLRMADFNPDGLGLDHDGSTVDWELFTRDYATGPLNENFVKKMQLRYELLGDGTATIIAENGTESRPSGVLWGEENWGEFIWSETELAALLGQAPESTGDKPYPWNVHQTARYVRFRLRNANPATRTIIRSIELFVRPSGRM